MTESADTLSDETKWGARIATAGIAVAMLFVAVALVGFGWIEPLYWVVILLAISGVVGAAVRGAESSTARYAGGVVGAMIGVLLLGYGVEDGSLWIALVGALVLVGGVLVSVVDTRRNV